MNTTSPLFLGVGPAAYTHPLLASYAIDMAEVSDWETGRLTFRPEAVVGRYLAENQVSIEQIDRIERTFREDRCDYYTWLLVLLRMAPSVPFTDILMEAVRRKMRELSGKGVNPKAEIEWFNRNFWRPFILQSRKQQT